ncbi:piggyBac transposable element-derived protein 5-like, partial [Clytia hemisphaerica]|uniref:piggyBac transposable element-derived protein 5-like n=1 Tax=Clytia hemisphaerica TaxID=252671 RepID=UPI0034D5D044
MATSKNTKCFDLNYAVNYMLDSDNSDIDSSRGGLDSDEEEKLDDLLMGYSDYDQTDDEVDDVVDVVENKPSDGTLPPSVPPQSAACSTDFTEDDNEAKTSEFSIYYDQQSNTIMEELPSNTLISDEIHLEAADILMENPTATENNNHRIERIVPSSPKDADETSLSDNEPCSSEGAEVMFIDDESVLEHISNYRGKQKAAKRDKRETKVTPPVVKESAAKDTSKIETSVKKTAPKKDAPKKAAPKKTAPKKTAPKKTAPKKTDGDNQSNESDGVEKSYDDPDTPNTLPEFNPHREPGFHNDVPILRGCEELDFFQLNLTDDIINTIVTHTNTYAWLNIEKKKSFAKVDGSWKETNAAEMKKFIALILYMGIVRLPQNNLYWSTKSLFHGLWARAIMSRDRFKALLSVLHVVDPSEEEKDDKLKKVRPFINHFRNRCKSLYQPEQNLAIDERLVKSKHRSGIKQYLKNKPAKFGIKLWVIADSATGYTWDFIVYTGAGDGVTDPIHGLGYGVVMNLSKPLFLQGYHLYFDNFYTSSILVEDLFTKGIPSCGTTVESRKGFPDSMKGGKFWAKAKERGDMRWARNGKVLNVQWKDNKVVTMVSSIDRADKYVELKERQAVIRQLANLNEYDNPPTYKSFRPAPDGRFNTVHVSSQVSTKRIVL